MSGVHPGASPPASLDVGLLREFATLKLKRDALKSELDRINGLLTKMEEPVRNALIDSGVKKLPVSAGGFDYTYEVSIPPQDVTVHLWSQVRGRRRDGVEVGTVGNALMACDLDDFVHKGYNWEKLDSYVREQIAAEGNVSLEAAVAHLPSELSEVLTVYKHVEARCRKG